MYWNLMAAVWEIATSEGWIVTLDVLKFIDSTTCTYLLSWIVTLDVLKSAYGRCCCHINNGYIINTDTGSYYFEADAEIDDSVPPTDDNNGSTGGNNNQTTMKELSYHLIRYRKL